MKYELLGMFFLPSIRLCSLAPCYSTRLLPLLLNVATLDVAENATNPGGWKLRNGHYFH